MQIKEPKADEKLQMGPDSTLSQPPPMVSPASKRLQNTVSSPEHPASKGLSQRLLSALHTKELKDQNFYKGKI